LSDYYTRHQIDTERLHKAYSAGTKLKDIADLMDTTLNAIAHKISDERRLNPSMWPLRKYSGHTRTAKDRLEMYKGEILLTIHVLDEVKSDSAKMARDHWKAIAERHRWINTQSDEQ
jgi:hypothetical protein